MAKKARNYFTTRLNRRMRRKLLLVFSFIALTLVALSVRIGYIITQSGDAYSIYVLAQQGYDSQTIPYRRGDILDANGNLLATSTKVYNVILDSKVLNANSEDITSTVAALCQSFPDLDSNTLFSFIEENPENAYHVLLKRLSYEEIREFVEMQNDDDLGAGISGVWFETEYERSYPFGSLAASVIGFSSTDGTGINGLESYYNDTLSGTNGRKYGYLNSDSNLETTVIDAEDGNSIQLALDINVQSEIERILEEFNEEYKDHFIEGPGAKQLAVLVMDPNTGAILADAQYPGYDLSNPRDLSAMYTEEELAAMTEEEIYDALNSLWTNFSVSSTYEPGSTAKPFTVAAGLETGVLNGTETFECDGYEEVGGFKIGCTHVHGLITLAETISLSCNDALMAIARMEGTELFCRYQRIFHFGLRTGVDITGEARTDSLLYNVETMNSSSLATNSFGQNFNVTMVQLASAFCSVINGGNYYRPYFVQKILDENGNTLSETAATVLHKTISAETSALLRSYMAETVTSGTGKRAAVEGYTIGGKTGTAEKLPRADGNYLISFIGFCPVEDPQVVVYVIIDELNDEDQAQSYIAAELAGKIFSAILPYLGIYPDGSHPQIIEPGDVVEYISNSSLLSGLGSASGDATLNDELTDAGEDAETDDTQADDAQSDSDASATENTEPENTTPDAGEGNTVAPEEMQTPPEETGEEASSESSPSGEGTEGEGAT